MSRSDQLIGLNEWASKLVRQTTTIVEVGRKETTDGKWLEDFSRRVLVPVAKIEKCGGFQGMFETEHPLNRYTFPDGRVFQEFVQAEPWSSGPCFFLALKDGEGREVLESLWSDEDINDA